MAHHQCMMISTLCMLTLMLAGGGSCLNVFSLTSEADTIEKVHNPVRNNVRGVAFYLTPGHGVAVRKVSSWRSTLLHRVSRALAGESQTDTAIPFIRSMNVTSRISSRFAQTVMSSIMDNPSVKAKEVRFVIQLPSTAFMSNFTMVIDNRFYVAQVMSKAEAKKLYEEAQRQNKTAGIVEEDGDEKSQYTPPEQQNAMETFLVAVNVRGNSSVQFELTYQELLQRRLKQYRHTISVRPNQIVDHMLIDVIVYEPQGVASLQVTEPSKGINGNAVSAVVNDIAGDVKQVLYKPSAEEQQLMNATSGINGDLVIVYDVVHDQGTGVVQMEDGYLVHFFSPSGYAPLSKQMIFVIDVSGSMSGNKIEQTRQALITIIDKLRPEDRFMMILFSSELKYWPDAQFLLPAHQDNIYKAKQYVKANVKSGGGTNINSAMVTACEKLRSSSQLGAAMVVFLTDGQPSAGETNTDAIIANVDRAAMNRVSILSLGFGFDLDFELLQSISYRNNGFARRIYPGVDAEIQLRDFLLEVNDPVMYDVQIEYPTTVVIEESLTQHSFAQYFDGSELVVSGKLKDSAPDIWNVKIVGKTTKNVEITKRVNSTTSVWVPEHAAMAHQPGFLEKLYIYMKIKDLLRQQLVTDDEAERSELEKYALQLALDHHLVTPLTSFVITEANSVDKDTYFETDMSASGTRPGAWLLTSVLALFLYALGRFQLCN